MHKLANSLVNCMHIKEVGIKRLVSRPRPFNLLCQQPFKASFVWIIQRNRNSYLFNEEMPEFIQFLKHMILALYKANVPRYNQLVSENLSIYVENGNKLILIEMNRNILMGMLKWLCPWPCPCPSSYSSEHNKFSDTFTHKQRSTVEIGQWRGKSVLCSASKPIRNNNRQIPTSKTS